MLKTHYTLMTSFGLTVPQQSDSQNVVQEDLDILNILLGIYVVVALQSLNCFQLFVTPWTGARQDPLSSTISWSLLKFMSIEWMMLSNHLILCHPLLLPSIFSSIRVFFNESALCIRWPKDQNFSISPSNEYSRLISFTIDWFDLLAVQGALKSLLQYHCSKATVLQGLAF